MNKLSYLLLSVLFLFQHFPAFASCNLNISLTDASTSFFQKTLDDSVNSLELLRGKNGLVQDKAEVIPAANGTSASLKILSSLTSPTNIAFDLMIQEELANHDGSHATLAKKNLQNVLTTLQNLPYHPASGLFFSWYSTDSGQPTSKNISAVDNMHLALALWSVARMSADDSIAAQAQQLFSRMDMSIFFDEKSGSIKGNVSFMRGQWSVDWWDYGYFGSEARSIFSAGFAIGLFRSLNAFNNSQDLIKKILSKIQIEMSPTPTGNILTTWQGGAFQLLLPELLIGESQYSSALAASAVSYEKYIVYKAQENKLAVPNMPNTYFLAAHSACQYGIDNVPNRFSDVYAYIGNAGDLALVAPQNSDLHNADSVKDWEKVFTPYAAFLASLINPNDLAARLTVLSEYTSGDDHLYTDTIGWSDGVHVQGNDSGQVVPVILSLDQGMIALSAIKVLNKKGLSPSAMALRADSKAQAFLKQYYITVDQRLGVNTGSLANLFRNLNPFGSCTN